MSVAGGGWGGRPAVPGEEDHDGERWNRRDRRRQNHWRGNKRTVLIFFSFLMHFFFYYWSWIRSQKLLKNDVSRVESKLPLKWYEFSKIPTKCCKFLRNFANPQNFMCRSTENLRPIFVCNNIRVKKGVRNLIQSAFYYLRESFRNFRLNLINWKLVLTVVRQTNYYFFCRIGYLFLLLIVNLKNPNSC